MAYLPYDAASTIGGKLAAEVVADAQALKAKGDVLRALIKQTTADGSGTGNIASDGTYASVFGIEGNTVSGAGGAFYNAFVHASTGILSRLDAITHDQLADVYVG